MFCYFGVMWKGRFGYDDALDVLGIHGIGGTWGAHCHGIIRQHGWRDGIVFWESRTS